MELSWHLKMHLGFVCSGPVTLHHTNPDSHPPGQRCPERGGPRQFLLYPPPPACTELGALWANEGSRESPATGRDLQGPHGSLPLTTLEETCKALNLSFLLQKGLR